MFGPMFRPYLQPTDLAGDFAIDWNALLSFAFPVQITTTKTVVRLQVLGDEWKQAGGCSSVVWYDHENRRPPKKYEKIFNFFLAE